MPEHAVGDTSKFNELIPQALQQTLYTKKSPMYKKGKKASLVPLCHSQVSICRGARTTCNGRRGSHSLLGQFRKVDTQMPSGTQTHKATDNPWKSEKVTLVAYLQEVTSLPSTSGHRHRLHSSLGDTTPNSSGTRSVFKPVALRSHRFFCKTHAQPRPACPQSRLFHI